MSDTQEMKNKSPWNSLEVVKLIVSTVTAVLIFYFGVVLQKQAEENAEFASKRAAVVEQRVALWRQISSPLNDVYVYFLYVGQWKDLDEPKIIEAKRTLDKIMYSNQPFFTEDFFKSYQNFISQAFKTRNGWGEDAQLRTQNVRPRDEDVDNKRFTNEDNAKAIHAAYYQLLEAAAEDLDLKISVPIFDSERSTPTPNKNY